MAQQEPDIHNFSTSSSHRLPTISGSQALQHERRRARGIPTSLPTLDQLLSPNTGAPKGGPGHTNVHAHVGGSIAGSNAPLNGGVRRGHVTEIYGPPGVGKTTFGMQLAVNAMKAFDEDGGKVVWISTGKPMVKERLVSIQAGLATQDSSVKVGIETGVEGEMPSSPPLPAPPPPTMQQTELEEKLTYLHTTSLPHLLTMLIHPTTLFPPPGTSLVIIDDLSNLLNSSFPRTWNRTAATTNTTTTTTTHRSKQSTARRFTVLAALSTALPKLAASRHLAVVLLNSATTSLKQGQRAVLKPALSGRDWDGGVDTRVVLLRDFWPEGIRVEEEKGADRTKIGEGQGEAAGEESVYRLAIVTRVGGRDVWREGVGFVIGEAGMREVRDTNTAASEGVRGVETVETQRKKQTQPADFEGPELHTDAGAGADADQQVDVDRGIDMDMGVEMEMELPTELALDLPLRSSSPLRPGEEVFQRASQVQRSQQNQQSQQNLQNQQNQQHPNRETDIKPPNRKDDIEGPASHDIEDLVFHGNQPGRNGVRSENRKMKRKAGEIADSEDEDEQEDEQDEMLV